MKKLLFTALLSLIVIGVQAQKKVLKSANKALNKGTYAEAIDLATQASTNAETQDNPDVYVILGKSKLYQFKEDVTQFALAQESFDYFQTAIEKGGDKLKGKLMEEVFLNGDGDRLGGGEGLKWLQVMLTGQGNQFFDQADYESSYNYYHLAGEIEPGVVIDFFTGYSAYQSERDEEAIKYYERVLEADAKASDEEKFENVNFVYNGLIDIYFNRVNDYDKALHYVGIAKKLYPEEKSYKDYEIDILIRADKMDEAISGLQTVIDAGQATEATYYTLAYLLWSNGDNERALVNTEKALEINPKYYDALYVAGSVHYNQAVEMLKEANNTDDNDEFARLRDEAIEKFKLCQPIFEECRNQKPEDLFILRPLSTIYDQLKMPEKRDEVLAKIDEVEN